MKRTKQLLVAAMLLAAAPFSGAHAQIRNVIFMIGDGMGFDQVFAAETANGKALAMTQMPVLGAVRTYSASNFITDSAASGTANACGVKTTNKMIGMTPDSVAVESVMSVLKGEGFATGIVTTCSFTHATPAAYFAHQPSRYMDEAIAADLTNGTVDVLFTGGRKYLEERTDGRNITQELRQEGYKVAYSLEEAAKVKKGKLLTLVADKHPVRYNYGRGNYLPQAVTQALNILEENKAGFFLMVEGSQIDWGGHANNADFNISETLDFDNAVAAALAFAKEDGHTLVIVTADHETGGMAIADGSQADSEIEVKYTTGGHTASYVPVFAYGPGAEVFTGIMENSSHKAKILELLGK